MPRGDGAGGRPAPAGGRAGWRRLVGSPQFQAWAARFPLTRRLVRREGEALMRIVGGFVDSQILSASVELGLLEAIADRPMTVDEIARRLDLEEDRVAVLARGAAALSLLSMRGGRYRLARRGVALLGVPGLVGMIRHHRVLYEDLADPAAFFRNGADTRLTRFWPYVLGGVDRDAAARYSDLMAESQALVAQETLAAVDLSGVDHLMDVGGGTGAFLAAVARRYPKMRLTLADLPAVIEAARARLADSAGWIEAVATDFRAALPRGADAISLIRVLYDHDDATVAALLARVRAALPPGGRAIVAEPMLGTRSTDTYFAVYTLAMGTGRTRSPERIAGLLAEAGFSDVRHRRTSRPFIASVVEARVSESVRQD